MSETSWTDKPNPEFEQWWATKTKAGYQYGREALENVRFGFEGAQKRVRQLEQLNPLLAERIDRQRPVIEAAQVLSRSLRRDDSLNWSGTEEALERLSLNTRPTWPN